MRFIIAMYFGCFFVSLAWSAEGSSSSRTGEGQIVYSWQGDPSKATADCNRHEKFTSKLVVTALSGGATLYGENDQAKVEYYLTIGGKTEKIVNVETVDMELLYTMDFPPTYDSFWKFMLISATRPDEILGSGYTTEGFYHSRGKLDFVANGRRVILGWQSNGDGFRIGSSAFRIFGKILPATIDHSVGYCQIKWTD